MRNYEMIWLDEAAKITGVFINGKMKSEGIKTDRRWVTFDKAPQPHETVTIERRI